MVSVGGAALGVLSSTPPFSGSLGSAIVQRDQLLLPEQGLPRGFYTATCSRPSNHGAGMSQGQTCTVCSQQLFPQVHDPNSGTPGFRILQTELGCDPLCIRQGTSSKDGECGTRGREGHAGRASPALAPRTRAVKRTARKEQPLLTRTQFAAREQLALAREGKVSPTSLKINK